MSRVQPLVGTETRPLPLLYIYFNYSTTMRSLALRCYIAIIPLLASVYHSRLLHRLLLQHHPQQQAVVDPVALSDPIVALLR